MTREWRTVMFGLKMVTLALRPQIMPFDIASTSFMMIRFGWSLFVDAEFVKRTSPNMGHTMGMLH